MSVGDLVPIKPAPLEAQIIAPPVPPSEMTDAQLGAAAAEAVDRATTLRADSTESALRAGEYLMEAKHRCDERKTSFRHWLAAHWPKSRTTALAYIKIAQEVQQDMGRRADLLACQSIRQFLTERGYGAGGTRDEPQDEDDKAAHEEATIERLLNDAEAPPKRRERSQQHAPALGGLASSSSATIDPAEITRRAEIAQRIAAERKAVEQVGKRDQLHNPPENPHQVGHPKPEQPTGDGQEVPCHANDLREIADRLDTVSRDLAGAASDLNCMVLFPVEGEDPRDEIGLVRRAIEEAAESVANLAKRRGHQLREIANHDARLVGIERERRDKAGRKGRKGA